MACAISGVAGAGLATTALPATSAAVIWPVKIASGKFHGLMHTNTPRPCSDERVALTGGPGQHQRRAEQLAAAGRVVAAEVHRLAQLRHRVGQRLAGLAHQQAEKHPAPLAAAAPPPAPGRRARSAAGVGVPRRLRRRRRRHRAGDLRRAGIAA